MNLSYTRGDDPAAVTENFRRAGEAMGFPLESIVASDQTHTTHLRRVTRRIAEAGSQDPENTGRWTAFSAMSPG